MLDINKIREDFEILRNNKDFIYFDNACMTLKPSVVIDKINEYYKEYPVCAGRSSHKLSLKLTQKIKEVRINIAKFINAKSENEIIFTKNTTEGINLIANSFLFKKGDIVLLTDKEHNSNLIPWLYLRDRVGIEVRILPSKEDGSFDIEKYKEMVVGVSFVSFVHTSNLDGYTNPAKEIIKLAHENSALVLLDCAQSITKEKIDVLDLDVDFIVFSGHKVFGPTGTGILYGKNKYLEKLNPFIVGGDTVEFSTYKNYKMLLSPQKFEAGLQDYANILGLGEAIKYIQQFEIEDIKEHFYKLNEEITNFLNQYKKIKIIGPVDYKDRSNIINFYIENQDMHESALMLDEMSNIAVRSGQHCVHPYFNSRKIRNSLRISLSIYNTKEEVDRLINSLEKIFKIV